MHLARLPELQTKIMNAESRPDASCPEPLNPVTMSPDTPKLDTAHLDTAHLDTAHLNTPDTADGRDSTDSTTRLADELLRFARLGSRAKGILHKGELGAEFSALMLLFPLKAMGPLRVTDLAEVKQADPSTISRQVAQLVKAGLARREADQIDGRASRLAITDAGLDACRRLHEARYALLSEALGDWPAERIATFADLFREFNSSVEALMRKEAAAPSRENA
jgi:DNA-binding MarR family transcriptional regulator